MSQTGFIILRHVNNELSNKYWNLCYDRIRIYYPENPILIIDDNSNYEYINKRDLYETTIINSEYHGRGELLPYYYYLHNKLFDSAIILHDSVFINSHLDLSVNNYKILWDFEHDWDQVHDEINMINVFNDNELLQFYENKHLWKGCFGGMTIITHEYLSHINSKYDFSKLLPYVLNRHNRCSFERVIACLLQINDKLEVMFGNIHSYAPFGISFEQMDSYTHVPILKVFTGR